MKAMWSFESSSFSNSAADSDRRDAPASFEERESSGANSPLISDLLDVSESSSVEAGVVFWNDGELSAAPMRAFFAFSVETSLEFSRELDGIPVYVSYRSRAALRTKSTMFLLISSFCFVVSSSASLFVVRENDSGCGGFLDPDQNGSSSSSNLSMGCSKRSSSMASRNNSLPKSIAHSMAFFSMKTPSSTAPSSSMINRSSASSLAASNAASSPSSWSNLLVNPSMPSSTYSWAYWLAC
mmetsp:Transcript_20621/g.57251  ORF Transcript_20621/g.57251 Transcript_20621/m.57251 type:complete len:240 (-) Transcript_20621:2578-3297(-)